MPQITFRIPGVEAPEAAAPFGPAGKPQPTSVFVLGGARAEGGQTDHTVNSDTVVEVELENGLRFWVGAERFRDEVLNPGSVRGAAADVVVVPTALPGGEDSRGIVGRLILKTLKFFDVDLPGFAAKTVCRNWEDRCLRIKEDQASALTRVEKSNAFKLVEVGDLAPGDKPMLLFLHGTASSTQGSFGELWQGSNLASLQKLFSAYDDILALEHRSLTESPIRNALDVVDSLPAGARLHLVSHSRGGLVGELLCRGDTVEGGEPFSEADMAMFAKLQNDSPQQADDLRKLNNALLEKRIKVERFVRAACPARGTTLASGRFDLFLSGLLNQLERVPIFKHIVFDVLFELALEVAKQRLEPDVLPGLEAMVPGRPLVKLLNGTGAPMRGRLRVIAGDIEGNSLGSLFKTLLTDAFYLHDHDLVVNTASMFGGSERRGGAAYYFRRGSDVSHFSYFQNSDSVERLVAALTLPAEEDDGFKRFEVRASDHVPPYPDARAPRAVRAQKRGAAFLLPGIMGSHLKVGDNRIWFDFFDLAGGGLERLKVDATQVEAEAPIAFYYGRMRNALDADYDVVEFPYDWRLSLAQAARRLAASLGAKLDEMEGKNQPVHVVAHSMGGLVVRAMIAGHPEVWQRLCRHKEARLVMLGTPNAGSHSIGLVLTGRDKVIRMLETMDFRHDMKGVLDIVREYPGVLELLPNDLRNGPGWEALWSADTENEKWDKPDPARLDAASAIWSGMNASGQPDPARTYYVAGRDDRTPTGIEAVQVGQDTTLQFTFTSQGDGRVPWATGIPNGVKAWYAESAHGDLCNDETVADAVLDILERGETRRLGDTPPVMRGAAEMRVALPTAPACLYPSFEEVTAAALGARFHLPAAGAKRKIRVSLTHGNLAYAKYPVLVGHYQGDTLVSAEAHLDRVFNGRLSAALRLGLYPGAENTAEVFLNRAGRPSGAIVVGLGQIGVLAPGDLERAVSRGVCDYGAVVADGARERGTPDTALDHPGLSVLLVGTNSAGVGVRDAVSAILRGIARGVDRLEQSGLAHIPQLEEIELIELYEDRAILAAHALQAVRADVVTGARFEISSTVQVERRRGGRARAYCDEDKGWWQRLQIVEDKQGRLAFNLLTDRARAESFIQPTQRKLVDQFIAEAARTGAGDPGLTATLYEMVIPNDLKEYAPEQRDIVLVVNDASARYPWELMREGRAGGNTPPLSVAAGMLRQLQSVEFRKKIVYANGLKALVVGDPDLGKENKEFKQLAGAREEAKAVGRLLDRRGYDVAESVGENACDIMSKLHAGAYRILHLAGHGAYNFPLKVDCEYCGGEDKREVKTISGMVIGPDLFLTPADIRQLRAVPELVFINCCHLGKVEDRSGRQNPADLPMLAANLATELIRMGVRAVVAAGWEVDDTSAKEFAERFYEAMLAGRPFGEAVKEARKAIYRGMGGNNTWGAYQCYGDPAYRLEEGGAAASEEFDASYNLPSEALVELRNLAADATTATAEKQESIRKGVESVERGLPSDWLEMGDIRAALGFAYGDLGDFDKAIPHYQAALKADDGKAPLKAAEQLANLEARLAVKRVQAGAPYSEVRQDFDEAAKRIRSMIETYGESVERHIMLGSVYKRQALAQLVSGVDTRQALEAAQESYDDAARMYQERTGEIYPYPVLYASALAIIRHKTGQIENVPLEFKQRIDLAAKAGEEDDKAEPQYWSAITKAESQLVLGLAGDDLSSKLDAIVQGYLDAQKHDGSARELKSVREHLDFLYAFMERVAESKLAQSGKKRVKVAGGRESDGGLQALGEIRRRVR